MEFLQQLAALLVVAWLPGAAMFRMPLLSRERRETLAADERTFWAVMLSATTSLAVVLALGAASRYSFDRLLVVNALIALVIAVVWRRRLRMPSAQRVSPAALVPIALVLLCAWRFFPPSEYIMGGKDPGVYVNEGIQIAQRGSLWIKDATVATVPSFARELFYPQHVDLEGRPRTDYYGTRFMGFFVSNPDTGLVTGQFPHLFPASIAIGYAIDGLTGARRAVGVWAILGVLAVYFAGARLFGRMTAGAAAALLALHVAQLWFARYPNAEVVMQAVLFTALLASARAHVDKDVFFAPIAGSLLGLLLFLRFDSALAIAAITGAIILSRVADQRIHWLAIAGFAVPAALAAWYLLVPMRAYAELPILFFGRIYWTWPWWRYVVVALMAVAALALFWGALRRPAMRERLRTFAPIALATVVVLAALYALLLRQPVNGKLAEHDAFALRMFANLYVTVPALVAALLGFFLTARTQFWRDAALFVTVAVFSLTLFYKIRIVPEHFWLARRFIPVILPGVLLFACAAAFATAGASRRSRIVRWTLGGIFVLLLAANYTRVSRPVLQHTEYEGLIPKIEALASRFTAKDLVIVEGRRTESDVHVLALPLAYVYAKNVLLLQPERPDKATLAAFIAWARTKFDNVYFIGGGGTDLLSHAYGVRSVGGDRFQVPEFETTRDRLPRVVDRKEFEYGVYAFTDPPAQSAAWFDLDVGTNDDLHVQRFHAKEVSDGRSFRWTRERSFVAVTTMTPRSRELTLVMADGGRPPAAPQARVEVYLHNQLLGAVDVSGPLRPYSLPIPSDLAERAASTRAPVELRLVTRTWKPAEVLGSPDDRSLGVMLDRVTIR